MTASFLFFFFSSSLATCHYSQDTRYVVEINGIRPQLRSVISPDRDFISSTLSLCLCRSFIFCIFVQYYLFHWPLLLFPSLGFGLYAFSYSTCITCQQGPDNQTVAASKRAVDVLCHLFSPEWLSGGCLEQYTLPVKAESDRQSQVESQKSEAGAKRVKAESK